MGYIDSGSKSSRLLASRRYTHNTLTTAQESFTNVLDLQASEIYTQASKIPSSSLPFSGSSQLDSTHTVGTDNIIKYWYRHKLTKSNVNNEVWFFLDPSGSDDGVGAQLINDNQEVNFVSPKYSLAGLATSTTEDSTPGYLASLFKSSDVSSSAQTSSLSSDDIVSTNDYQFDYKTGIVQFMSSNTDPSDTEYLFMTVNQYVGKTLATGIEISGGVSGSSTSTGSFGRVEAADTGSFGRLEVAGNSSLTGDLTIGGNITIGDADSDSLTISADLTSNLIPNADSTYDVGSTSKNWRFGHIEQLSATHVTASSNISASGTITANVFSGGVMSGSTQTKENLPTNTLSGSMGEFITGSFSGSITSTGSFAQFLVGGSDGTSAFAVISASKASGNIQISGSKQSTGSFGRIETAGYINASGKVQESGVAIVDTALAFSIVFGG